MSCRTSSIKQFTPSSSFSWPPSLKKAAVLQVVFDDDVSDGVEHKLHVLSVSRTGKVGVNFLCVFFLVEVLKLGLDVTSSLVIFIGS